MKPCTIFYSWQSDIRESRNLISDCLQQLPKKLKDMVTAQVDRDTVGLAGAPDIGDSIYEKIDACDLFVADVTIINSDYSGRKTPNPNVMLELGYAIKALGWDKIVLICCGDYGDIEQLPFDINHRRILKYSLQDASKADVRKIITGNIAHTIEILLENNRLYGSKPEITEARKTLTLLLSTGMERAWFWYFHSRILDENMERDDFVVVTDEQMQLIEKVKYLLTDEQYLILHDIFHNFKMANIGTEDKAGWEFIIDVISDYVEPLYQLYAKDLEELPWSMIVTESFAQIYDALTTDQPISYVTERIWNGRTVFNTSKEKYEVYAKDGSVLCSGTRIDGNFTGYRKNSDYEGEYLNGRREGVGNELSPFSSEYQSDKVRRKGSWKNNQFMQGDVFGVVLVKNQAGDDYEYVTDHNGQMLTTGDQDFLFFNRMYWEDKEEQYYIGNLRYEKGEYNIIDGTVVEWKNKYEIEEERQEI